MSSIIVAFDNQTEKEIKNLSYGMKDIVYGYKINANIILHGMSTIGRIQRCHNKVFADLNIFDSKVNIAKIIDNFLKNDIDVMTINMLSDYNPNDDQIASHLAGRITYPGINIDENELWNCVHRAISYHYGYIIFNKEQLYNQDIMEFCRSFNIKIIANGITIEEDPNLMTPEEAISMGAHFIILDDCLMKYSGNFYKLSEILDHVNAITR